MLDSGGHLMVGYGREVESTIADFLEKVEAGEPKVRPRRLSR